MGSSSLVPKALVRTLGLHAIGTFHPSYNTIVGFSHHVNSKGGPLAVTDANLLLGRLVTDFFPKIFGKSEKEPLDIEASRSAFEKVAEEINQSYGESKLSLDEI